MKHTQENIANLLNKFIFPDKTQENGFHKQIWFCKKNN